MSTTISYRSLNYIKDLWRRAAVYGPVLWDNLTWSQAVSRRQAAYAVRRRERKVAGPLDWEAVQITIIKSKKHPGMYALRFAPDYLDIPGETWRGDGQKLKYDPKLMRLVPAAATESSEPTQ